MARLETFVSIIAMIGGWWALSAFMGDPETLPSPATVLSVALDEAINGPLFKHMLATIARVAAAFGLAMAIGVALGYALGRLPVLDRWLDPWVIVLLTLPRFFACHPCRGSDISPCPNSHPISRPPRGTGSP